MLLNNLFFGKRVLKPVLFLGLFIVQ
ncbi:MAG: hypothetical protein RLZZ28_307, partial [Bacteroidota bacterium]